MISFLWSKTFLKNLQTYFSNKLSFGESKFCWTEKGEIKIGSNKGTKTFSSYFALVTESLDLLNLRYLPSNVSNKIQGIIDSFLVILASLK